MSWAENRTVRWSAGAALLSVLILIVAWFTLIEPRRSTAADLLAQDVSARQGNQVLRTRIEELRVQFGKLPEQRAKLAEITQQLPSAVDMPALLRSVDALATSAGVTLSSFSPGEPTAVNASAGTGAATRPAAAGAAVLYSIPVSVVVSGDYFQTVAFLRQLQTGMPRALLVTGLQIAKGGSNPDDVQVTISSQVFSRMAAPSSQAATPGPTPGPTPTPTPGPSLSATPGPSQAATPGPSVTPAPAASAPVAAGPFPAVPTDRRP